MHCQRCLALTSRDGRIVQKEDVWVSKISAAAQGLLPQNCLIDPQFSSKRKPPGADHGEVDIIVHNPVRYFIEFLITKADTNTVAEYPTNPFSYSSII